MSGRYYFAADSTPHYPGVHLLGSATWDDTNLDAAYTMGEVRGAPWSWDNGAAPAVLPLPVLVGSRDCVANGESFANALKGDALILGYPIGCYRRPQDLDEGFLFLSNLKSCATQRFYCRVIQALYADDEQSARDLVAANVPGAYVVSFHPATPNLPGAVTIVNGNYACIICDGTRNLETFVVEALYSLAGPINFGRFSTMPLWYTAATWLTNWLTIDGADSTRPIIFAGHSYGAAAATIAAARSTFPATGGPRFLFTIGCPRVGDLRLSSIVKQCEVLNLANDDDIVTISPPSPELLWQLVGPIGPAVLEYWPNWSRVYNQVTQDPDGILRPTAPEDPDFAVLFDLVTRAIAHAAFDFFEPHYVASYLARIVKRCPDQFVQGGIEVGTDVPDGRAELGWEIKPLPGPSCAEALYLNRCSGWNGSYSYVATATESQWYKFPVKAGFTYTITYVVGYDPNRIIVPAYLWPNCIAIGFGQVYFLDVPPYDVYTFTPDVDTHFWLEVGPMYADVPYSFTFDGGPCDLSQSIVSETGEALYLEDATFILKE